MDAESNFTDQPAWCIVRVAGRGGSEVVEGLEITGTRSCGTVLVLTKDLGIHAE